MEIIDGLAYIDFPLTVGQVEEVLSRIKDKNAVVVVNDETCADSEITAIEIDAHKISFYINGKVEEI